MILVGMLESPYVRRVAISAQCLGVEYKHRPLSVFNDYDELRQLNPLVKAPTLVCDDGTVLVDSTLIIQYLSRVSDNGYALLPGNERQYLSALKLTGVALVAIEKIVQVTYETMRRPADTLHKPWLDRLLQQLDSALQQLDNTVTGQQPWLYGKTMSQADISIAVAWRVSQYIVANYVNSSRYQNLVKFSERAEKQPEFMACPVAPMHA
jgi:glutathione S-transferase